MLKSQIKDRIFEILKEISESKNHNGLLVVFSDINQVLARGAHPIGINPKNSKDFEEAVHISDENITSIIKKIGDDGAILINKKGFIYSPSAYLNVNLFSVDKQEIDPEFCARHIAALATSASTKATVYTLSEETGKVREFIKGKIKRRYPEKEQEEILKIIEKDIQKSKIIVNK